MNTETLKASSAQTRNLAGKYLTFVLGSESYGIGVLKIREIIRFTDITSVPQTPHYIRGVINLRGKIIPVVDMRTKFGLPTQEATERTCIIVVQVSLPSNAKTQMGLIVDAVEEVTNIAAGDIEDTPDFGAALSTEYLLGMAKIKGAVKPLLDIDKVVCAETLEGLTQALA